MRGLFIRLADVTPDLGPGPVDALAAWARTSQASRRGVDVGAAAIANGRFHFFLDGLDEVDSARHDEFARLINRFSTELPQHAFTISTRPLPGLALLRIDSMEASDWDQYELVPDKNWRDRYLARADDGDDDDRDGGADRDAEHDDVDVDEDARGVDSLGSPLREMNRRP